MTGTLETVTLGLESERIGYVLRLLQPFMRRRGRAEARREPAAPVRSPEIDVADLSVAEFRGRCSWE